MAEYDDRGYRGRVDPSQMAPEVERSEFEGRPTFKTTGPPELLEYLWKIRQLEQRTEIPNRKIRGCPPPSHPY